MSDYDENMVTACKRYLYEKCGLPPDVREKVWEMDDALAVSMCEAVEDAKEPVLGDKKMYFRVYQDRECVGDDEGSFYVDDKQGIENSLPAWLDGVTELFPVIEPVMMTVDEFENLPEFEGY